VLPRAPSGARANDSVAQRAEVHDHALGRQLAVGVEAVERDERQLDVALRRQEA
jgi:hypothetical protein